MESSFLNTVNKLTDKRIYKEYLYNFNKINFKIMSFVTRSIRRAVSRISTAHRPLGLGVALAAWLGGAAAAQAQTFACTAGKSYIFQGDATTAVEIDLSSGTSKPASNPIIPASAGSQKLNAFGYNQVDNYIWGQRTGTSQVVRVGSDYTATIYNVANLTGDVASAVVGDVSPQGIMYLTRGGSTAGASGASPSLRTIYAIDLTQATLTATALPVVPPATYLTDWAISPVDGNLYALYSTIIPAGGTTPTNAAALTLYRYQTTGTSAGTQEVLGTVVAGNTVSKDGTDHPITASNFGAAFMDSQGNFFVVANETGYVYRIDKPHISGSRTAHYVAAAPAGAANTDGARCPTTAIAATPLPVTLVSFTATSTPSDRTTQLAWTTASETNNAFFEVQRSFDGHHFDALAQVAGHGTSAQAHAYRFTDTVPTNGSAATCYYRLRQVDADGSASFSPVQVVTLAPTSRVVQVTIAPNPTTTSGLHVQAHYGGSAPLAAAITMHGLLGQTLLTQAVTLQPGNNVFTPAIALTPGIYWLSLTSEATTSSPSTRILITE
jgi:hypothetical protein